MNDAIFSQSWSNQESGSSKTSMHDQVFVDVLGHEQHSGLRCQPPVVMPSDYYSSQHTNDSRRRVETTEEITCSTTQRMMDL